MAKVGVKRVKSDLPGIGQELKMHRKLVFAAVGLFRFACTFSGVQVNYVLIGVAIQYFLIMMKDFSLLPSVLLAGKEHRQLLLVLIFVQ